MKLSICIVNWEGCDIFYECISSIIKNCKEIKDYEIIVVDNGSKRLDIKYLKQVKKLKLYQNKKNLLFSKATNQSIEHSSGDLILIINNDIILQKDCIKFLIKEINNYDAIVPKLILPNGKIQKSIPSIPTFKEIVFASFGINLLFPKLGLWPSDNSDYSKTKIVLYKNQPAFSALLIKKEVWKLVGKLDENLPLLWNDTDWFFRFHAKKLKCLYYPKAEALHYHGTSVNKNRFNKIIQSTKSLEYFLKKTYKPKKQYLFLYKLCCYLTLIERMIREVILIILNSLMVFLHTNKVPALKTLPTKN